MSLNLTNIIELESAICCVLRRPFLSVKNFDLFPKSNKPILITASDVMCIIGGCLFLLM